MHDICAVVKLLLTMTVDFINAKCLFHWSLSSHTLGCSPTLNYKTSVKKNGSNIVKGAGLGLKAGLVSQSVFYLVLDQTRFRQ